MYGCMGVWECVWVYIYMGVCVCVNRSMGVCMGVWEYNAWVYGGMCMYVQIYGYMAVICMHVHACMEV